MWLYRQYFTFQYCLMGMAVRKALLLNLGCNPNLSFTVSDMAKHMMHDVQCVIDVPKLTSGHIQGGPKKVSQKLMTITLSNPNGFSKIFHHSKEN